MNYPVVRYLSGFLCIVLFCILVSCEGKCINERIEKVEWVTSYTYYNKDTFVRYSIVVDKSEFDELRKEIKHTIVIRNENKTYSNKFAVLAETDENGESAKFGTGSFNDIDFISIFPNAMDSFIFYTPAGFNSTFKSRYKILQQPLKVRQTRRVDELKTEKITVNSCEQNIEALKLKYKTTKELFNSKKP